MMLLLPATHTASAAIPTGGFQLLKYTIFKTSTVCVFFGEMMGLN